MQQQAEPSDALKLYRAMSTKEAGVPEKGESAPSAVWAAWLLLAMVLAAFVIWSSGPIAYEFTVEPVGAPQPELIGP